MAYPGKQQKGWKEAVEKASSKYCILLFFFFIYVLEHLPLISVFTGWKYGFNSALETLKK